VKQWPDRSDWEAMGVCFTLIQSDAAGALQSFAAGNIHSKPCRVTKTDMRTNGVQASFEKLQRAVSHRCYSLRLCQHV
jgi:hypothetical protein